MGRWLIADLRLRGLIPEGGGRHEVVQRNGHEIQLLYVMLRESSAALRLRVFNVHIGSEHHSTQSIDTPESKPNSHL